MFIQTIGLTMIVYTTNFWLACFALFLNGLCCTSRVQIGILYMYEFIPRKNIPAGSTAYFQMEAATALFGVLYFSVISTDAQNFLYIGYAMQIIGSILAFFIPESPKYLFKRGRDTFYGTFITKDVL